MDYASADMWNNRIENGGDFLCILNYLFIPMQKAQAIWAST